MTDQPNFVVRAFDRVTGKTQLREELGTEIAAMQDAIVYLTETAYMQGPYQLPPQELFRQLEEYDSQLVDELINQRMWDVLGSSSEFSLDELAARNRAIEDSQRLWVYSPVAQWQIWTWTNYGVGDSVTIAPDDPQAGAVIDEFWEAERNSSVIGDDSIHDLSNFTLLHGNVFLAVFASKIDGISTVEEIPYDEITEIVRHPHMKSLKVFYKREFTTDIDKKEHTIYYPDWNIKVNEQYDVLELAKELLPEDAILADSSEPIKNRDLGIIGQSSDSELTGTDVAVLHISHNRKVRKSPWGWPILTAATPYINAHKRFMNDRLTVAASKAQYVRRKQIKGGSRALASIQRTIASRLSYTNYRETNPPAGAGSIELDNAAVATKDLPMTTGAADARQDNDMFIHHALLGGGLFPTTAGLDAQRWATALQQDKTLSMQWARYQTFWAAQFRRLTHIVLFFAEKYGDWNFDGNYSAQVSIDTLSLVDFPDVVDALSTACRNMLKPYMEDGTITMEAGKAILRELWLLMLQALGVSSSSKLTSKTAFQIEEPTTAESTFSPMQQAILRETRVAIKAGSISPEMLGEISGIFEEMADLASEELKERVEAIELLRGNGFG